MKHLLLALSFFSSAALADGVDNMVAQCEEVMRCQICRVANDTSSNATKLITYVDETGTARSMRVTAAEYDYIRNTGYDKDADGHFVMCQRIREVMKNPTSTQAMGARALFSQTWIRQKYCP